MKRKLRTKEKFTAILTTLLIFSEILSCNAFASNTVIDSDREETLFEGSLSGNETDETFSEVSDNNLDKGANEPEGNTESVSNDSVSDNTVSDNTVSTNSLSANEVEEISAEDRVVFLDNKGTEEEAIDELPDTWTVKTENGIEKEVDITWECADDFYDDEYTSYVFQGTIDDDEVSSDIDEEEEQKLVMEVYFESEIKTADEIEDMEDGPIETSDTALSICKLSPNTIIPEIEAEQGTDQISQAFDEDYGEGTGSVIETYVSYRESNAVLSSSAYNTFQSMSPSSGDYMYSKLSSAQRSLYDKLDAWVTQYLYYGKEPTKLPSGQPMTAFISGTDLTSTEAINICELYFFNNPQAFFLTSQYYCSSGPGGEGYNVAVAFIPYADTPSEIRSVAESIASSFNSTYDTIAGAVNDYQKSKRVHDVLCDMITYDSYANSSQYWGDFVPGNVYYDQTIMSVFYGNRKQTVCAGYAKANTALLRRAGLKSFSITSRSHEWNKVYLYGEWYCTDVTWDDLNSPYNWEFFLKSDATLKTRNGSHEWEDRWTGIAPASPRDYDPSSRVYTITYYMNGGINDPLNPSSYTPDVGTITLRSPSRTGYSFGGWYLDSSFNTRISVIKGSDRKNYVIYAKWIANDPGTTDKVEAFVTRLYRVVLGRDPDAAGLHYWSTKLKSGTTTGAEVVSGFYLSDEMNSRGLTNAAFVECAYNGIMGRNSDPSGKSFWVDALESGTSNQFVIAGFTSSSEFDSLCNQYGIIRGSIGVSEDRDKNLGITKYVSRLYTCALSRHYDINGLNYWCGLINNDKSRENVMNVALNGFLHSQEFMDKGLNNGDYVRVMYRTFLDREPESSGYRYWLHLLNTGTSRDDVARGFAYSEEFSSIMASYGL